MENFPAGSIRVGCLGESPLSVQLSKQKVLNIFQRLAIVFEMRSMVKYFSFFKVTCYG